MPPPRSGLADGLAGFCGERRTRCRGCRRRLEDLAKGVDDAVHGDHRGSVPPRSIRDRSAWSIRARLAEVDRPDLHLHDLRHSGNTWAAATGASTAELMARMGHASPVAALRYQHATEKRDRAIAPALSKLAAPAPIVPIGDHPRDGAPKRPLYAARQTARKPARTSGFYRAAPTGFEPVFPP